MHYSILERLCWFGRITPQFLGSKQKDIWGPVLKIQESTRVGSKFKHRREHLCPSSRFCYSLGEAADTQVVRTTLHSSFSLQIKSPTVKSTGCAAQRVWFSINRVQHEHCQYQRLHKWGQRVFTFSRGRQQFRLDGHWRSCGFFAEYGCPLLRSRADQNLYTWVSSPFSQTYINELQASFSSHFQTTRQTYKPLHPPTN